MSVRPALVLAEFSGLLLDIALVAALHLCSNRSHACFICLSVMLAPHVLGRAAPEVLLSLVVEVVGVLHQLDNDGLSESLGRRSAQWQRSHAGVVVGSDHGPQWEAMVLSAGACRTQLAVEMPSHAGVRWGDQIAGACMYAREDNNHLLERVVIVAQRFDW